MSASPLGQFWAIVNKPDICIGTDSFHTSEVLAAAFITEFEQEGWVVRLNDPFAGALVPMNRYRQDHRVMAIMVEINRRLYLQGDSGDILPGFAQLAHRIRQC